MCRAREPLDGRRQRWAECDSESSPGQGQLPQCTWPADPCCTWGEGILLPLPQGTTSALESELLLSRPLSQLRAPCSHPEPRAGAGGGGCRERALQGPMEEQARQTGTPRVRGCQVPWEQPSDGERWPRGPPAAVHRPSLHGGRTRGGGGRASGRAALDLPCRR